MQLSQHYEAALRRWAQVELSPKTELNDASKRLAQAIAKTALEERDAAYHRMVLHELSCPVCQEH